VRLDNEAALKSRQHIRQIVANWSKSLGLACNTQHTSKESGHVSKGEQHCEQIIHLFDATDWSASLANEQSEVAYVMPFNQDGSAWFKSASEWSIGKNWPSSFS
jgi:hypothetical protein